MKVIGPIARGGYGRVEKVQLPDGTHVARKTFDPRDPAAADPQVRKKLLARFKREVRTQQMLPPEYVVPILNADLNGDAPWCTMPLAEKDFAAEIAEARRDGTMPSDALLQILEALEHLHAEDYAHRDLKPSNVLFQGGRWKLADFGLARLPPDEETAKLTGTRSSLGGTLEYEAPEQATIGGNPRAPADIYAFGCMLHDLVVGSNRTPYSRHSAPGLLGPVIEKCTEVSTSKRFKSVDRLRAALLPSLAGATTEPDPRAADWAARLENSGNLDADTADKLARFIGRLDLMTSEHLAELNSAVWPVMSAINNDVLGKLAEVNPEAFGTIAARYCEWAAGNPFYFDYCDVVVDRLLTIFRAGTLETKALAAVAAARLGSGHNRFHVMGCVLHICGKGLAENVARRIAVEIHASEMESRFLDCAMTLGKDASVFHPLIAEAVGPRPRRTG